MGVPRAFHNGYPTLICDPHTRVVVVSSTLCITELSNGEKREFREVVIFEQLHTAAFCAELGEIERSLLGRMNHITIGECNRGHTVTCSDVREMCRITQSEVML